MWRSIPINVTTPLIVETGLYSKGYPRWTLSYRRGFPLWSQEAKYERRFLRKTAPTISFPLSDFRRRPTPIHSIKFWGKSLSSILIKLGNSPKIPRRISRERFELGQPNWVIWSKTSIPTCVIFFRILDEGMWNAVASNFQKIRWGQTAKQLQGLLHNKVEIF